MHAMEEATHRRSTRKVDMHVGGWRVCGYQSHRRGGQRRESNLRLFTRTVRRKTARERWEQSNLEMIVAVPWRKNEDNEKMAGGRLKGEVVLMEKDQEKLEMEEHVPVPKRVYVFCKDLETIEFTARCLGCLSML